MNDNLFTPDADGFYGRYYPCKEKSNSAVIFMLGPDADGPLVKMGVRYMHKLRLNVLALSPEPEAKGFVEIPLERFIKAARCLKDASNVRVAIAGGSATASIALAAASCCPDISLCLAMTPCDFIMEGYYRDGLDGAAERPGDYKSTLSFGGKPLPFLPYAYRHPLYWQKLKAQSRAGGNAIASRQMFDLSERLSPIQEEQFIKVENIRGSIIFAGSEDDCLWDTCRYIRRMQKRIESHGSPVRCRAYLYEHATHFIFPQSMLSTSLGPLSFLLPLIFKEGRRHPFEARKSREDFDLHLREEIELWKNS